jgi:hypothetical protein
MTEMTLSQAKATQEFALRVARLSEKYGNKEKAESAKKHAELLQKKIDELEAQT